MIFYKNDFQKAWAIKAIEKWDYTKFKKFLHSKTEVDKVEA
jgi:hypothetical protein